MKALVLPLPTAKPALVTESPEAMLAASQQPPVEHATEQQVSLDHVEQEVRAFLAHYIRTLESKDEAAVRKLFVADARFAWFTYGVKSYSTAAEVLEGMRRYAGVTFKTTLSEVRVVPLASPWRPCARGSEPS